MQVVPLKDANSVISYWQVNGKGTIDDPYIPTSFDQAAPLLRAILKALQNPGYDRDSSYRQKVVIDNISGSLTLGTVSTLTNAIADITKICGLTSAQYIGMMSWDPARIAYNSGIRANLRFKNI